MANDKIRAKFYKQSKVKQIEILFEALDYMQQYNGRSKWDCIKLAME